MDKDTDAGMDRHGEASPEDRVPAEANRRGLIRAAAGGLVLAASGLLLPETEARANALGGVEGERRGTNHRERKRKRKKKEEKKSGDIFYTLPGMIVYNERAEPAQLRGLQRQNPHHDWYVPSGWDWAAIPAKATGDPAVRTFAGNWADIVVQIGTDRVVEFYFDWPVAPDATIYSGGWEYNGWNPKGTRLAGAVRMPINDKISTSGITATRITDFNGHVWLRVELS